jgi:two-component system cell cycle sensor histidine kinase/response regulator CckA
MMKAFFSSQTGFFITSAIMVFVTCLVVYVTSRLNTLLFLYAWYFVLLMTSLGLFGLVVFQNYKRKQNTRSRFSELSYTRGQQIILQDKDLLQSYFFNAPFGLALLEEGRKIKSMNPAFCEMIGLEEDRIFNQDFLDFIDDSQKNYIASQFETSVAEKHYTRFEMPLKSFNVLKKIDLSGPEKTLLVHLQLLSSDKKNLPAEFLVYLMDITDRKMLEMQFSQSQKMQAVGQLAGGIAHDFNNLLTAISGFCDLLLQRHIAGDPSFADINHIHQNAKRATALVRQLLAFSRQQKLELQVLKIPDAIAEITHLLQRLIGESIQLDVQHVRELWNVRADKTQLEQVIVNLCVNARDAMDHGGSLLLRTENVTLTEALNIGNDTTPSGDYVILSVTDTGKGIDPTHLNKIFDPFFSTKEVGSGTGLGLATVYGIVRQSGGIIEVNSALGRGTTFKIYLPRYTGPERVAEVVTEEKTGDLTGMGTILLVEDEDPVRIFSSRVLKNKGYTVIEARSGDVALQILQNDPDLKIDLLLTDVMMPVIDGPTLIEIMRKKDPDLKVICVSGYAEESIRTKLESLDHVHFIPKPFSLKQLAGTVKMVLES